MNALDEYRAWTPPEPGLTGVVPKHLADAAVSALEAAVDRMKCCGNCAEYDDFWCDLDDGPVDNHSWDACRFTPSRWREREP